jgi:hypothetical protein
MNWSRIVLLVIALGASHLFAQQDSIGKDFFTRWGVRSAYGAIVVHSADVENTSGSRPFAIELEWSRRKKGSDAWDLCRCYPTTGAVLGYHNYDNNVLGIGIHGSYFVQYHFLQRARVSPAIRGSGGIAYNSRPHHIVKNPQNQSYSLPFNFSVQLSALLDIRLSDKWAMDLTLSFNHISNGGIRQPNKGINWSSLGAGLYYIPDFSPFTDRSHINPMRMNARKWFYRLALQGSGHTKVFNEEREFFPVVGMEFLSGYFVSNLNSLTAGIDWNYDGSRIRRAQVEQLTGTTHRVGVHIGHEFVLGNFRFTQKLGIYLLDRLRVNDLVYHKWGILYVHRSGLLTGIELKAHRHVAEFILAKIGWQF